MAEMVKTALRAVLGMPLHDYVWLDACVSESLEVARALRDMSEYLERLSNSFNNNPGIAGPPKPKSNDLAISITFWNWSLIVPKTPLACVLGS